MRTYKKPKRRQPGKFAPKYTLAIGRIYLVKGYWTGNFRAKCCDSLALTAKVKVTDPMNTELNIDDEMEISFANAEFLPAVLEEFQKPIEERRIG
jgi:hypothetical protein